MEEELSGEAQCKVFVKLHLPISHALESSHGFPSLCLEVLAWEMF